LKLYAIGARVAQATYGTGTITSADEYHTVIDFDEHGVRTFASRMVQLETSNTLAPPRPKRARRKTGPRLAKRVNLPTLST
jgi:hypothetical protein